MAVRSQAKEGETELRLPGCEEASQLLLARGGVAGLARHAVNVRRHEGQERPARHVVVGCQVVGRDAALVAEEDLHAIPVVRLPRQALVDGPGRLAAGKHDGARPRFAEQDERGFGDVRRYD